MLAYAVWGEAHFLSLKLFSATALRFPYACFFIDGCPVSSWFGQFGIHVGIEKCTTQCAAKRARRRTVKSLTNKEQKVQEKMTNTASSNWSHSRSLPSTLLLLLCHPLFQFGGGWVGGSCGSRWVNRRGCLLANSCLRRPSHL